MAESVAPEFARFIASEREAQRLKVPPRPTGEGQIFERVRIDPRQANLLLRVAARRASGLFRPSKHTEVVWVEGADELAVSLDGLSVKLSTGLVGFVLPVRCDHSMTAKGRLLFAVGSPSSPSGFYAASSRLPEGTEVVVNAWGQSLVACAWHCLLELVTGIAGATGKDKRGNLLVPVELSV